MTKCSYLYKHEIIGRLFSFMVKAPMDQIEYKAVFGSQ